LSEALTPHRVGAFLMTASLPSRDEQDTPQT
jgi:hypothetical protein